MTVHGDTCPESQQIKRLRQDDGKFEGSHNNLVRPCLKRKIQRAGIQLSGRVTLDSIFRTNKNPELFTHQIYCVLLLVMAGDQHLYMHMAVVHLECAHGGIRGSESTLSPQSLVLKSWSSIQQCSEVGLGESYWIKTTLTSPMDLSFTGSSSGEYWKVGVVEGTRQRKGDLTPRSSHSFSAPLSLQLSSAMSSQS